MTTCLRSTEVVTLSNGALPPQSPKSSGGQKTGETMPTEADFGTSYTASSLTTTMRPSSHKQDEQNKTSQISITWQHYICLTGPEPRLNELSSPQDSATKRSSTWPNWLSAMNLSPGLTHAMRKRWVITPGWFSGIKRCSSSDSLS